MTKVYIGTSGFNYKHWADGVFYPEGLSQSQWLDYYSKQFKTVELNVTFYRLPKEETFNNWRELTPKDFVFSIKGSRLITHLKKLNNCREHLELFLKNSKKLEKKLAIILWQFGSNFKFDKHKINNFCNLLVNQAGVRQAFEFRHKSWFCESIYQILKKYNYSLVFADSKQWPLVEDITADYIYLRFHGHELYSSNYSDGELKTWAEKIKTWMKQGLDVYAYFNNDMSGYAVRNAKILTQLLK